MYVLFKYPKFGLLWFAQLFVYIGDAIFNTALVWWFLSKNLAGANIGLVLSLASLPAVVLGPFAGTLVDLINPKCTIIIADICRAFLVLYFAYLSSLDIINTNFVYLLIILFSIFGVFHGPATLSVIGKFVNSNDLNRAMAIHSINRDISKLIGPSICGIIIANLSISSAFKTFAVLLIVAVIMILLIPFPSKNAQFNKINFFSELKEGFIYVHKQSTVSKMLIMLGFLNFFVIPIVLFIPLSVKHLFNKGSYELGLSESLLALGSIFVGFTYEYLFVHFSINKVLFYLITLSGFVYILIGSFSSFGLFLGFLFVLGICFAAVNITMLTYFQRKIKDEMKGRFFSLVEVISYITFPVSLAFFGYFSDYVSVKYLYFICGFSIVIISCIFNKLLNNANFDNNQI